MRILYVKGDLLECPEKYILHGCNAQGVMGSGIALAIKKKYPKAYEDYLLHNKNNSLLLGDVVVSEQPDGKVILNAVTQEFYGRNTSKVYVDYEAISSVVKNLNLILFLREQFTVTVALPKIGAGLGGGDWKVISSIIENESEFWQPVVYEL